MAFHDPLVSRYAAAPEWMQTATRVVAVVALGWLAIRFVRPLIVRAIRRAPGLEPTLATFIVRTFKGLSWIIVAIIALGVAGVDATALAGGVAVGGFIVGFAVKDTLGNLAAGITLLLYRPFVVGDTVTIAGVDGEVRAVGLALTTIKPGDARIATIPNSKVLGDTIINHTREPLRRADVTVGIAYDDDIDTAVKAILTAVAAEPRVVADPEPSVRITALGASSVDLQVRPWVRTEDFFATRADLHAVIKGAVEGAGCSIPFPQREIHVHNV